MVSIRFYCSLRKKNFKCWILPHTLLIKHAYSISLQSSMLYVNTKKTLKFEKRALDVVFSWYIADRTSLLFNLFLLLIAHGLVDPRFMPLIPIHTPVSYPITVRSDKCGQSCKKGGIAKLMKFIHSGFTSYSSQNKAAVSDNTLQGLATLEAFAGVTCK